MKPRIREMLEERARMVEAAGQILARAESEKRDLTSEESAQFDKLHDDALNLKTKADAEHARDERQRQLEAELSGNRTVPSNAPGGEGTSDAMKAFRSFLLGGRYSLTEGERRALQVDSPTAGGFLVAPQQFVSELIKAVDDQTFSRQLSRVIPVTGADSLGAASLDADPADATWTSEIGTGSEDNTMAFGKRELKPYPLAKRIKISRKLMRLSATPAEALVRDRLAYKFGITFEKAGMTGSGAGSPLGVFTASNDGIPTGRDVSTGNTTTEFTWDGLVNAKYSLKGGYLARAAWVMHRDAVKMAAKIKDGDGLPVFQLANSAGTSDRLLGLPLHMSEYAPNTFTTGLYVAILGDFSYYWIADSLQLDIQRLDELYAESSQIGFIGRMESDAMPVLGEAFARVKLA